MNFMNNPENTKIKDVILVVDDQPINLKVIASVLSQEYSLSIANSGVNALKMLEKGLPSLILLDIMMPEMDGFEVCRQIKENEKTKDIPVIFLTAKTDIKDIIKGFDYGAADYITKPFNTTEMKVRVVNHLNLYHAKNELKEMNQKLLLSQEAVKSVNQQLEQSNKEKDKFFCIIAHDLKSPFNGILGLSEMLRDEAKDIGTDSIVKFANLIHSSTQHTFELLKNLLEWARMQQGRIPFAPKPFLLNDLVNHEIVGLSNVANQKNIELINGLPSKVLLTADENMIRTVLRNLVANAIKFTPKNGKIKIDAHIMSNAVEISVSDTGLGMSQETIAKLFKIETSFTKKGTENETGTGLGLILCKEFIEKHNGRIWVESKEGQGSIFSFVIPQEK
jgi:signal transduction histidine kinase